MKDTGNPSTSATPLDQDSLRILRDVSHLYETAKEVRKAAVRAAHKDGHTFKAIGDAMGVARSRAHAIVNEDAA